MPLGELTSLACTQHTHISREGTSYTMWPNTWTPLSTYSFSLLMPTCTKPGFIKTVYSFWCGKKFEGPVLWRSPSPSCMCGQSAYQPRRSITSSLLVRQNLIYQINIPKLNYCVDPASNWTGSQADSLGADSRALAGPREAKLWRCF